MGADASGIVRASAHHVKWSVNTKYSAITSFRRGHEAHQIYGNYLQQMNCMEATSLRSLSGAAMPTSLAYFTLLHSESDIPGHPGPTPPELKTPSHPPSYSMCLLMGVLDQLQVKTKQTEYPLTFMVICTDCQRYS